MAADKPRAGAVAVDEAALQATLRDGELELSVPVRGLEPGAGTLTAELISVDRKKIHSSAKLSYQLARGERRTLATRLRMPAELKTQAERARYSVMIYERSSELRVTRSLLYVLSPVELRLEGPAQPRADKRVSYRVLAQHPLTRAPQPDVSVNLELERDDQTLQSFTASTDDNGAAVFELNVDEPGTYSVAASAQGASGTSDSIELSGPITVRDADRRILLTSDKPLYQPGQLMHVRALALESPNNTPLAGSELLFEIADGKGNKVFKRSRKTDDYGIASVDFRLANLVNMGTYTLKVSGGVEAQKTVEVARYVLPKFEVQTVTDRSWYEPGHEIAGSVESRYFFGKSVSAADVSIEALTLDVGSNVFQRVMGKTDEQGRFAFAIPLPDSLAGIPLQDGNALVTLRARVTDAAGQVVQKDSAITVAAAGVRMSLVPEASQLVPGIENRFHLFATDPLGGPVADAAVSLSAGGPDLKGRTDAYGHVELRWQLDDAGSPIVVELTTREGDQTSAQFDFAAQSGGEHVLVRTDKTLYAPGESVRVQVLGSRTESRVYVDWLNDGQAVDMRTLELEKGVASFEVALDASLIGENRIEAYVVDEEGQVVRAGRTIVVNREGGLRVTLSQDKPQYRPGEAATLTLAVTDEQGKPAPSALGVQIVDEAVFGLIDARPGLLRTYFELEDSFTKPTYEIHVPPVSFEKLLFEDALSENEDDKRAAQAQAEAQLSALSGQRMLGLTLGSWQNTVSEAAVTLAPFFESDRKRLIEELAPSVKSAVDALAVEGCGQGSYFCSNQGKTYAQAVTERALQDATLIDFWGNRYTSEAGSGYELALTTAGADEKRGTIDDKSIEIRMSELGLTQGFATPAAAAATGAAGAAAAGIPASPAPAMPEGDAQEAGDSANPRVRSDFPETLYVNPALITDADGKANISLDMADSITSWRVSALANARSGALGGGQGAVTVFQDFFVDIDFPAELTRGDQVDFPVVVYNYLKTEQTVRLELEAASWFTPLGDTTSTLTLAANEVKSVRLPVRVDSIGTQTLTVRAFGTTASDAIARSVRVIPDGVAVPQAQSGSLAAGVATLRVDVPANAIAGSALLYLDVYPAFTSQAVQGLDSMLQVPSGCFEQTTSTTWPNVLVTSYLEQTKQSTPEIQLKAESLISAGYQRLLTFEHSSGGYSWFGESDGEPDVSVTAFGLMEFADMSKVHEVDPAMIMRTQQWLVAQQAADGSFAGGTTEFFSFQTSALRNTAFVAWALAQSGYQDDALARALEYVRANVSEADDSYTIALAANALAAADSGDPKLAELLELLDTTKQTSDGKTFWDIGESQTNFYARGQDAAVSSTALAAHAMILAGSHGPTAKSSIEYVIGSKDATGNFGSTQASVWALKVLMLAATRGTEGAVGNLEISVDGEQFAALELDRSQWDVNVRIDMSTLASAGAHDIELEFAGSGDVSYNLVNSHHVAWAQAPVPPSGPLAVAVTYDRTTLAVDETVNASLRIDNLTPSAQNMVLVSVGLPPGFELLAEDLDAYLASGQLSRYERTAKQLILYITELAPSGVQQYDYRLRAKMPVRAADGGSQAYLYYQPDQKTQSASTLLVATGP